MIEIKLLSFDKEIDAASFEVTIEANCLHVMPLLI